MKIRQSFVANSSSSSFIIGCSKVPQTVEEAGDVWFGSSKHFIGPIIIQGLFEGLIPVTVDYDLLLELAKKVKWKDRYSYSKMVEYDLLYQLSSNFDSSERYPDYSYMFENRNPFDEFVKKEEAKLMKKYNVTSIYDKQVPLKSRYDIEDKWFAKKDVKERFINEVEYFIKKFKQHEVLMKGSFADDEGELGSELEHGHHWGKFPQYIQFSHH